MIGKSCLINKFVNGNFESVMPRGGDYCYTKNVKFMNRKYGLKIRDIGGWGNPDDLEIDYFKYVMDVDAYIYVFSVDDKKSFAQIQTVYAKIRSILFKSKPVILVGTKSDSRQIVTIEEAEKLANFWNCPFCLCSAKNNENISKARSQLHSNFRPNFQKNAKRNGRKARKRIRRKAVLSRTKIKIPLPSRRKRQHNVQNRPPWLYNPSNGSPLPPSLPQSTNKHTNHQTH